MPDYVQHFLDRHGVSGSAVKLGEYIVRPGETLFAMGTLGEGTAKDSAGAAAGVLSAEAADLQRLEELGGAVLPVSSAVHSKPVAAKASEQIDLGPAVILGNGPNHPLFISVRSQHEIVQRLAWKSALCIWGGPVLTLCSFWYLLTRLGYQ